jgi:hypothetical protein
MTADGGMVGTQAVRFVQLTRADTTTTATILSGGSTSTSVDFMHASFGGLAIPAAFTGTSMTFTVCGTIGGTYQALNDKYGTAVSMVVAQGKSYPLPMELAGWPYFKIVSGSSEGADRIITIVRKR